MKYLLALTGTTPNAPERATGTVIVTLTVLLLSACAFVMAWALSLVA